MTRGSWEAEERDEVCREGKVIREERTTVVELCGAQNDQKDRTTKRERQEGIEMGNKFTVCTLRRDEIASLVQSTHCNFPFPLIS
jgi:hypothetical protein